MWASSKRQSHHPNVSGGTDAPSGEEIHSLSFIILKRVPKTMRNENNIMSHRQPAVDARASPFSCSFYDLGLLNSPF